MSNSSTPPESSQQQRLVAALTHVLTGFAALRRYAKSPEPADVVFALSLLPKSARSELLPRHVFWAAQQFARDPAPPDQLTLPMALMRYLYPLDAAGLLPRFEAGLRKDLASRMASDAFCSLDPPRPEYQVFDAKASPMALLASQVRQGGPRMGRQARIAQLEALARATGVSNPREPAPPPADLVDARVEAAA